MDTAILKLAERIFEALGDMVVSVESIDGWEGSNVRIVLKELKPNIIDKIMEIIWEVEEEIGKHGIFIPEVVKQNELSEVYKKI